MPPLMIDGAEEKAMDNQEYNSIVSFSFGESLTIAFGMFM